MKRAMSLNIRAIRVLVKRAAVSREARTQTQWQRRAARAKAQFRVHPAQRRRPANRHIRRHLPKHRAAHLAQKVAIRQVKIRSFLEQADRANQGIRAAGILTASFRKLKVFWPKLRPHVPALLAGKEQMRK